MTAAGDERLDVLHVSEAYGGGVQSAINRYIENSQDCRHAVFVRSRDAHDVGQLPDVEVVRVQGSMPTFVRAARRAIRDRRPRVVHLHSSFAGVLRIFDFPDVKVVYTPHSYAFLREDIHPVMRAGYLGAEYLLSRRRRQVIAAISPHEVASAVRLTAGRAGVHYLPNVAADAETRREPTVREEAGRTTVVTVGRISAQKDPAFLARVVEHAADPSIEWTWIGDGDAGLKRRLVDAGVTVTGWLPNTDVMERMSQADLYFHPASWEGAPMTLLEAAALGTPVLVREIDTLRGLGFASAGATTVDVAATVTRFSRDHGFRDEVRRRAVESVAVHSADVQRRALEYLYDGRTEVAA
ncbi:glycosyltransferase family 4 protein [Prescottella sp. R16]|uniref:glycosyltransferase family 4 protein n=1 Tax=Prescottella sp. R16 TaxID=3064529 RepID=UPI00272E7C00|nr:glycosyltransferase family 4 protein [Prescottella sp. R16]